MKKNTILIIMAVIAVNSIQAFVSTEKKDFLGEWKFESSYAPEEYQSGVFFIYENKEQMTGEIKFTNGYKVEIKDMVFNNGVLEFGIEVESNYVNLKATIEDNVLKGTATSPEGEIPFEAKRLKMEKQ